MLQEERAVRYSGVRSEKPPPFALVNWDGDQSTHSWIGDVEVCSVRAEPHLQTELWVWQNFGGKSEFTALQTVVIHVTENAKHLVILEIVNRSDVAMQKEKPVFSFCGTCFPGLLERDLESYSNMGWNILHVLGRLPKNFLTGSNCEFVFLSGCREIYSTYGFLGSLRYACDKIEAMWIIEVLSKQGV